MNRRDGTPSPQVADFHQQEPGGVSDLRSLFPPFTQREPGVTSHLRRDVELCFNKGKVVNLPTAWAATTSEESESVKFEPNVPVFFDLGMVPRGRELSQGGVHLPDIPPPHISTECTGQATRRSREEASSILLTPNPFSQLKSIRDSCANSVDAPHRGGKLWQVLKSSIDWICLPFIT